MSYLKNLFFVFVAVTIAICVAVPVLAGENETPQEKERRYLNRLHDDLERQYDNQNERDRQQNKRDQELRAREQQQQATVVPPAGEFIPAPQSEVRLVPRSYYYYDRYYNGWVAVDGFWPLWWVSPAWWYTSLPYGYAPIGRIHSRFVNNTIMVNNVQTLNQRIDRGAFERHVRGNFHSLRANANALQPQRQFQPQRNMSVARSPQHHRQQFQPQPQPRPQYRPITPAPKGGQVQRDGRQQQHHR